MFRLLAAALFNETAARGETASARRRRQKRAAIAALVVLIYRGDIFRVQTCRVSQTIVFRYREIGGRLCTRHRKK
jgi:hypothetical protein